MVDQNTNILITTLNINALKLLREIARMDFLKTKPKHDHKL